MIKLIHCLNEVKFSFHKIAVMKTNTGGSFRDAGARSVLPLAAAPVGPAGPGQQAPERQVRPRGPAGPGLLGCRASGRVSSVSSGSCLLFVGLVLFAVHCFWGDQVWSESCITAPPVSSCCFSRGHTVLPISLFFHIWPLHMCPNQILQIINRWRSNSHLLYKKIYHSSLSPISIFFLIKCASRWFSSSPLLTSLLLGNH